MHARRIRKRKGKSVTTPRHFRLIGLEPAVSSSHMTATLSKVSIFQSGRVFVVEQLGVERKFMDFTTMRSAYTGQLQQTQTIIILIAGFESHFTDKGRYFVGLRLLRVSSRALRFLYRPGDDEIQVLSNYGRECVLR